MDGRDGMRPATGAAAVRGWLRGTPAGRGSSSAGSGGQRGGAVRRLEMAAGGGASRGRREEAPQEGRISGGTQGN